MRSLQEQFEGHACSGAVPRSAVAEQFEDTSKIDHAARPLLERLPAPAYLLEPPTASFLGSKQNHRVLFVDDEPGIRATLPLVLQKEGFDVTVSSSVAEAQTKMVCDTFEALLTDLNIDTPGDGYALVRAIRRVNPRCATIILTGYPDVPSAVEAVRERVDDYLLKPANIDVLVKSLKTYISSRKPKARILSVSLDEPLLRTRHMLLEREGYDVVSSLGLVASLKECSKGGFDLFILGHSIDYSDKKELVDSFRRTCPAPIVSLGLRGEEPVEGADYHIDPDPKTILETVSEVIRTQNASEDSKSR